MLQLYPNWGGVLLPLRTSAAGTADECESVPAVLPIGVVEEHR